MLRYGEKNRSKFPEKKSDGTVDVDLSSHKYVKLWQGPQHPGVTGNMSVELDVLGDEVMRGRTHVGYLHRGFEKLMEKRKFIQNFPLVCRVCVPEPDFNEYCYAAALEDLAGVEIPEAAKWIRTLVLEMARLQSYLMWLGGQAGSFGMGIPGQWTIWARDLVLERFEELTGARIYHIFIIPGGVRNMLPQGFKKRMNETLETIEEVVADVERVLLNNAVFKKRTVGLGIIDPDWVDEFGITGPNARGAGVPKDVRVDNPYLKYGELDVEAITETDSDIYSRTRLRMRDLLQSVSLIRQIMDKTPSEGDFKAKMPSMLHWKIPAGETYVKAECTRGEYGYYIVTDGSEYPRRVNVRGPSYTHAVTLFEKMLVNCNIADVAGTMVSLHTYPPEIER
ncbi:MAG: NADH-quinone oxidoreductase subunit D [Deltaproteobacteria bacterium]|nr:NADH-quinone oxidoreductase subunit D [Deltaproteobacteria bacterium]